jgi:hypothetical protein
MKFNRRLTLFLFGALLGTMFVYFFMGNHNYLNTPTDVIKTNLVRNPVKYDKISNCQRECLSLSDNEVLEIMSEGDITFNKSEVHATPCKKYWFEGKTKSGRELNIIFGWCERETMIYNIEEVGNAKNCNCK